MYKYTKGQLRMLIGDSKRKLKEAEDSRDALMLEEDRWGKDFRKRYNSLTRTIGRQRRNISYYNGILSSLCDV